MSSTSTPISSRGLGPKRPQCKVGAWGEVLWDVFHREDGTSGALLGGSAANVAFHAAQLGATSSLISRTGRDERGSSAIHRLRDSGVDVRSVATDPTLPTGTVDIRMLRGEPSFHIGDQVAWDHITASGATVERIIELDVLCFSSLAQRTPLAASRISSLCRFISKQGAAPRHFDSRRARPLLFFDLNMRPPFLNPETILACIRHADLLKLNDEELHWVRQTFDTRRPLDFLFRQGAARWIALTHAANGATLHGHSTRIHVPARRVTGGDPVGAGDSFLASLAVELTSGGSLQGSLERSAKYASWVASQDGAMPRKTNR